LSFFPFPSFSTAERAPRTLAYRVQALKARLPEWAQDWLEIIIPATQILLIVLAAWLLQYVLRRIVRRAGEHYQLPDELVVPIRGLIRWFIVTGPLLLVLERLGVSATVLWTAFTGFATLRLKSDYLAITTFGVAVVVQLVALNAQGLTGGPFGVDPSY